MASLREIQGFFTDRAAGWEERTAGYLPQIERTIAELDIGAGQTVLDLGCGTGIALPLLRAKVGSMGRVVGLDATEAMLEQARQLGRAAVAELVQGDVHVLPFPAGLADWIYCQGLLPHLHDPALALREMHRVARPQGRLLIFHALGRVALSALHHKTPSDDEVLAPVRLCGLLEAAGWQVERLEDAPERFLLVGCAAKRN